MPNTLLSHFALGSVVHSDALADVVSLYRYMYVSYVVLISRWRAMTAEGTPLQEQQQAREDV